MCVCVCVCVTDKVEEQTNVVDCNIHYHSHNKVYIV